MAKSADLAKFRENYYVASAAASQNARTLALAGLAFIWLFRPKEGGIESLPGLLYVAGCVFVLVLVLDVLHYAYASAAWGIFSRYTETRLQKMPGSTYQEVKIEAPEQINWPTLTFFWGKQLALFGGYVVVALYTLLSRVYPHCIPR